MNKKINIIMLSLLMSTQSFANYNILINPQINKYINENDIVPPVPEYVTFVKEECGYAFCYAIDTEENLWFIGANKNSLAGEQFPESMVTTWTKTKTKGVKDIRVGVYEGAIKKDDGFYVVGRNFYANLGTGNKYPVTMFTNLDIQTGLKIKDVHLEEGYTYILADDGYIYSAGSNQFGILNSESTREHLLFKKMSGQIVKINSFNDMNFHAKRIIAKFNGKSYALGDNYKNMLLANDKRTIYNWTYAPEYDSIPKVKIGNYFMVKVVDGKAYFRGSNTYDKNGIVNGGDANIWVKMPLSNVTDAEVGMESIYLKSNNEWYGAGYNEAGGLGVGSSDNTISPFKKLTLQNIDKLIPKSYRVFAEKDGEMYGAGNTLLFNKGTNEAQLSFEKIPKVPNPDVENKPESK